MTEPRSAAEVFAEMPRRFNAAAASGLDVTYQFVLGGDDGGTWHVRVFDGKCEVLEGPAERASISVEMAVEDYIEMVMGRLSPQIAFVTDKLRIAGDMALATRMQELFPPPTS